MANGFAKSLRRNVRLALAGVGIFVQSLGAKVHPTPLIVLGNQKSGTTAIAALLADMVGLPVALDLKKEIHHPSIQRVKNGEISFADLVNRNKLDFSRPIIKEPALTFFYNELADYFPASRFVMVIRDPRDNIRSILNRLDVRGDLPDVGESEREKLTGAWPLIMDNRWLGIDGGNYIESLAHRWNYTTDLYKQNAERSVLVRYEAFLKDKVGVIAKLAKTLGLPQRHDISDRVDLQFQPAGNRSARPLEFFGRDNLARIESICSTRMAEFGYERIL